MKVYNTRMLSGVLDRSEEEVLELLQEGKLAGEKLFGDWFVSERQVREYLDHESRENKSYEYAFW